MPRGIAVMLLTGFEPFTTGQGLVLTHNPTADIVLRVAENTWQASTVAGTLMTAGGLSVAKKAYTGGMLLVEADTE